ncbi:MAG TPA: hypothetical protein VK348_02760 [Planctomycetota bacterium]|nr:hypothetical protein [Planctomycetota bacterium]
MMPGLDHRIGDVLQEHLRAQGLPGDSGVSARWVKVRFLGVPVVFPNFDARRAVLVTHDVHHLLTGYPTTWRGEAEISAFEIVTGCKRYWAAWFFNLGGFLFGLWIAPSRTFRAFARARRCTNFYGADAAAVLQKRIGEAQRELGLDRPMPAATRGDLFAFLAWAVLIVSCYLLLPLAVVATIAWAVGGAL